MRTVMNADPTHKAIRGAMGSALGTGSGVLVALIFMTLIYFRYRGMFMERVQGDTEHEEEPFGPLMIETILVITPFILSSFIMNLTTSLNQTIFIKIMIQYKHWEEALTTTLYGLFFHRDGCGRGDPAQYLHILCAGRPGRDQKEKYQRGPHDARDRCALCHWASCPGEACDDATVPAVGYA